MRPFVFNQKNGRGERAGIIARCGDRGREAASATQAPVPPRRGLFPRVAVPFLLCTLLTGCATMVTDACRGADWYALGLKDGSEGRPANRIEARAEACAEVGMATDLRRYAEGHANGLRQYCRLENAFSLGASGGNYAGVCPPAVDAEFRSRFAAGRAAHDAKKEVKRIESLIEVKERELRKTHTDEEQRLRAQTRDDERRRIRREFEQRRTRLRADIEELDRKLRRARDRHFDAERSGRHLR